MAHRVVTRAPKLLEQGKILTKLPCRCFDFLMNLLNKNSKKKIRWRRGEPLRLSSGCDRQPMSAGQVVVALLRRPLGDATLGSAPFPSFRLLPGDTSSTGLTIVRPFCPMALAGRSVANAFGKGGGGREALGTRYRPPGRYH